MGSLLFSTQQCSYSIFLCFLTKSLHKTHKMSETEAKTDAVAEKPTAEEIKATKRPAEEEEVELRRRSTRTAPTAPLRTPRAPTVTPKRPPTLRRKRRVTRRRTLTVRRRKTLTARRVRKTLTRRPREKREKKRRTVRARKRTRRMPNKNPLNQKPLAKLSRIHLQNSPKKLISPHTSRTIFPPSLSNACRS